MAELENIYERVEKGIVWLSSHDPESRFHTWFEAKITPANLARSPRVSDEDRERYGKYHKQRTLFERLWARMTVLERTTSATQSQEILSRTRDNDNFTHTRGTLWKG